MTGAVVGVGNETTLNGGTDPAGVVSGQTSQNTLVDGRYLGENGQWWVDLRVDVDRCSAISGDLHTVGGDGRQLSFRTIDDPLDLSTDTWSVRHDGDGAGAEGSLTLEVDPLDGERVHLTLTTDSRVVVTASRVGSLLRALGIEVDVEPGVREPGPVAGPDGSTLDVTGCLRRAGIDAWWTGEPSEIDMSGVAGSWHGVDILEKLNAAMRAAADSDLAAPAFHAQLLYLSRSDRPGLCGLMFDIDDVLPRQGAAVFVDEIRDRSSADTADRRILQCAVHELGHVLNLTHRFSCGAWGSTSFMNYPDYYLGGGHAADFQRAFRWEFDADELEFLRHGFRSDLIPGGAQFGSEAYWLQAARDGEVLTEADAGRLRLWFTSAVAPAATDTIPLALGEPLFLGVSLANTGGDSVVVPRHVLDPKAGHLSILVRRTGEDALPVQPLMRRCYDAGLVADPAPWLLRLGPGQSLHENVNLSAGAQGALLKDPGEYEVTPVLLLPRSSDSARGVIVSGVPRTVVVAEEPSAQGSITLRAPQAAYVVALGGTAKVPSLEAAFAEVPRPSADDVTPDRVKAVRGRVEGLAHHRAGRFDLAAPLLEQSVRLSGGIFDPQTIEQTRRLARRAADQHAKHLSESALAPTVVDLGGPVAGSVGPVGPVVSEAPPVEPAPQAVVDWAWNAADGTRHQSRSPGVLRVNLRQQGWCVVAPAGRALADFDADRPLTAFVTVATEDGTTERLHAARVDLVRGTDGATACAVVWLPRPVRGASSPVFPLTKDVSRPGGGGDAMWEVLAHAGQAPAGFAAIDGQVPAEWSTAVDAALFSLGEDSTSLLEGAPEPVKAVVHVRPDLDDVAGIWCLLIRSCNEDDGRPWRGHGPLPEGWEGPLPVLPYPFEKNEPFGEEPTTAPPFTGSQRPA